MDVGRVGDNFMSSSGTWFLDEAYGSMIQLIEDDVDAVAESQQRAVEEWMGRLRSNPHYYIFWHEDSPHRKRFEEWDSIKLKLTLKRMMKSSSADHSPSTNKKSNNRVRSKALAEETYLREKNENPMYFLTKCIRKAYFYIIKGEKDWSRLATQSLHKAKGIMKRYVAEGISQEYFPAVNYLSRWIMVHICLVKGKVPTFEVGDALEEFDSLPERSKALLWATKAFFLYKLFTYDKVEEWERVAALRKAVEFDPLNYELSRRLGNWLRYARRNNRSQNEGPTEEEMGLHWAVYDKCEYVRETEDGCPSAKRNIGYAGLIQALAEVIKARDMIRSSGKHLPTLIRCGELEFKNDKEAVNYVLDGITRLTDESLNPTFPELIRAGDIVCNILPHCYRDYKKAEEYFLRARIGHERNSKVNHKLGGLFLTKGEHSVALDYLRDSYRLQNQNLPAAIDLLHTMMCSPDEHLEEIEQVLCKTLARVSLTDVFKSQFLRIRGYFRFMIGRFDEAVQCWIDASGLHPDFNILGDLKAAIRRYNWSPKRISSEAVRAALETEIGKTRPRTPRRATLEKLTLGFKGRETLANGFTHRSERRHDDRAHRPGTSVPSAFVGHSQHYHRTQYTRHTALSESDADDNWRSNAGRNN